MARIEDPAVIQPVNALHMGTSLSWEADVAGRLEVGGDEQSYLVTP